MTAVTANTNIDKPKIVFAGVDAGAKIFVELTGESGPARATAAMKQNSKAKIRIVLRVAKLCRCLPRGTQVIANGYVDELSDRKRS